MSADEQTRFRSAVQSLETDFWDKDICDMLCACPALEALSIMEGAYVDGRDLIKLLKDGPRLKRFCIEESFIKEGAAAPEGDVYSALATQHDLEDLYWGREISDRGAFDAALRGLSNLKNVHPR